MEMLTLEARPSPLACMGSRAKIRIHRKVEMERSKGIQMPTSISSGKQEARSCAKNEQVGIKARNSAGQKRFRISTLRNMLPHQIRINQKGAQDVSDWN